MSAVSKAIGQQVVEYLSRAQGVGHTGVEGGGGHLGYVETRGAGEYKRGH